MHVKLEFRDDKSQKFWEIRTEGASHTVRYGRIGSNGQTKTKTFTSASLAESDAASLAKKKRKKGYVDVGGAGASSAQPEAAPAATPEAEAGTEKKTASEKKKAPSPLDRYRERIEAVGREIKAEIYEAEDEQRLTRAMAFIRGESDELPEFGDEGDFEPLLKIFAPLTQWTEVDERVLAVIRKKWIAKRRDYEYGFHDDFYSWLAPQIRDEGEEDTYAAAVERLAAAGVDDGTQLRHTIGELADVMLDDEGRPTSVGRWLLARYPRDADAMLEIGVGKRYGTLLFELLARHAREDFDEQLPAVKKAEKEWGKMQLACMLGRVDGPGYRPIIEECLSELKESWPRFQVAEALFRVDADAFRGTVREIAEQNLKEIQKVRNEKGRSYSDAAWDSSKKRFKQKTPTLVEFLLRTYGSDAKGSVYDYVEGTKALNLGLLELATKYLGQEAMFIVAEGFGVPIDGKEDVSFLSRLLRIANEIDWSEKHDEVWELATHKSKPVREAAAVGIAGIGPSVVPRAIELSKAKKQDHRHGAALILGLVGDDASLDALGALVETEKSDDVRDPALEVLARAMTAKGRVVDDVMIESRFARARKAKKLAKPPIKWCDENELPTLHRKKGGELDAEWVRYLLYRQGRQSGAELDVELAPVLAQIDTTKSARFAEALWQAFLDAKAPAKDKHAMVLAGALGGEAILASLSEKVDTWAGSGRGALAEVGVHVLARIDSTDALRVIDGLRREQKGVAANVTAAANDAFDEAADLAGVSAEELADRVVPDLGFEGSTRNVEVGGEAWTARIGHDFRLEYVSPEGRAAKSLPRKADKALKDEMKALAKEVKAVAKEQRQRLEQAMVLGRRWSPKRYRELMLGKAIRAPFAEATVWARYGADGAVDVTFRSLGDGSLTSADNEEVTLNAGDVIGLVHAAEIDASTRKAWMTHFEEHELVPLLDQLERRVIRCPSTEAGLRFYDGVLDEEPNASTFLGRAGGMGWRRGSVVDAGEISAFHKRFSPSGVDAIVKVSGVSISGDHYSSAKVGYAMFVKDGSVSYGSYTYDEPRNESDERLIPLGEVPVVVYSEVVSDLMKMAGKS